MAAVTQSGKRTITTGAGSRTNYEMYHGVSCSFPVASDSGAVEGAKVTGARLYISALKSFSDEYYLSLSFGGGSLAVTPKFSKNENTHNETITLSSLSGGLLTDAASSIVLEIVTTNSTTGPKMLFRDGCTVTLEIDYAPDTGGGGDSGGGGGTTYKYDNVAVENFTIASNISYGERVLMTWEYPKDDNSFSEMKVYCEYSEDGKTWEKEWTVLGYGVHPMMIVGYPEYDLTVLPIRYEYRSLKPPEKLWSYYRCRVSTLGDNGELFSDYVYLQYVRPVLVPYTDDPIIAGETNVKAVHMLELQTNVNKIREAEGLSAYEFTAIIAGRTGLADWSNHIAELRFAIDEMAIDHEAWILFDINAPRADVITQLRRVVAAL